MNLIEEVPNLEITYFPKVRGKLKFQSRLIIYHLPNLGKSLNSAEPTEVVSDGSGRKGQNVPYYPINALIV